ncbi:hypothetical protein L195_g050558 [Trifolium pratense]|uniref:Uncharacterized protein n=2 Tax=Trifolium pratense TaxID=57577 RepID=A0A2K3JUM1_TRIPR|nr:hypothetical protein L195_g050558 [Trifolium pratense]CAJ2628744.1 unnamed protein product [Trifolium pratense]
MGGDKKKSSSGCFSIFNIFSSKNKSRGGYYDYEYGRKTWPSDEDKGIICIYKNRRAEDFICKYKNRISESESYQLDPAA